MSSGEKVRLGDVLEATFSGEWGTETGEVLTPVLRTANFNEDGGFDYETPAMRCIPEKKIAAKKLKRGDIVLEKSGGTPKRPVGIMAYYDSDDLALCSNFNQVLRVKQGAFLPRYAFHQLRWLKQRDAFEPYTRKTTGLQNLQMKKFVDLELLKPKLSVQLRAVEQFSVIEREALALKQQIAQLDQLAKSHFVEMFGDPNHGDSKWPKERLDTFTQIVTGNTPSRKKPEYYGEGIEWVKTDNIADSVVSQATECLTEAGRLKARLAPAGSILMACIAGSVKSIGKVGLLDREVAFNQQINAIIPGEAVDSRYLLVLLALSKDYLCSSINMQLKGILNKSALSAKEFPLPPLPLQQDFAAFAAQVDKTRAIAQQQIDKLQTLYDSLAQDYFA